MFISSRFDVCWLCEVDVLPERKSVVINGLDSLLLSLRTQQKEIGFDGVFTPGATREEIVSSIPEIVSSRIAS